MRVSTGVVGRVVVLFLLVGVTLSAVAPAVGPAVATSPAQDPTSSAPESTSGTLDGSVALQVTTATANDSNGTHHENPEEVRESGDLSRVRGWLAGRMGETLVDCTESLQNPNVEAACERKDEEYPDWLGQYVDTVRETENEDDDATADTFRDAREDQQKLQEQVRQFRETRREYEQARENGNTERARRKARELLRIAENVERTGGSLTGNFENLSTGTDLQLNDSAAIVTEIQNETAQTAEVVREDTFVETNVEVLAATESISFVDPLRVRGRLTSENGSALANRTITLVQNSRTISARTNATGAFTITYRPTTLSLNATRVEIQYVPRNDSVYLGNSTDVPVDVEQVNATVSTTVNPEHAGFDDAVSVTGSVEADQIGAPGVPIVVSADGVVLGRTTTDRDGRYDLRTEIPAGIPTGTRSITARIDQSGRALAVDNATASLDIESTGTVLTASGTDAGENTIRVEGQLQTVDGVAVPNQRVRLVVGNGRQTETLRITSKGTFAGNVSVPQAVFDGAANADVTLTFVFDGTGTNLDRSTTAVTVPVENTADVGGADGERRGIAALFLEAAVIPWVLGILVVGVLGTGWYYRNRLGGSATAESPPESETVSDGQRETPIDDKTMPDKSSHPDILELARERLDADDAEEAIVLSYTTARKQLANETGASSADTHWEFYTDCHDDGVDGLRLDDLRALTESYEQAAFATIVPSAADAEDAIETAERLVEADH